MLELLEMSRLCKMCGCNRDIADFINEKNKELKCCQRCRKKALDLRRGAGIMPVVKQEPKKRIRKPTGKPRIPPAVDIDKIVCSRCHNSQDKAKYLKDVAVDVLPAYFRTCHNCRHIYRRKPAPADKAYDDLVQINNDIKPA